MWNIFKKNQEAHKETGLENNLKTLCDVQPSSDQKARMKQHIMSAINNPAAAAAPHLEQSLFASLISKIKQASGELVPAVYFRTVLREKLITVTEVDKSRSRLRFINLAYSRRFFASAFALIFVFTLTFNFAFVPQRVEASFVTSLEEVQGEVNVQREDKIFKAAAGFLLKGDDTVRTGAGSSVAIRFLDQSTTRLDENTEVKISKLFVNPHDKTETVVEIVLSKGRVWNRVINLIDNFSRFQVKAGSTVATAKKKAAFDVSIQGSQKAKVSAIQNGVDLVVATNREVVETTLVKGFTAEVKNTVAVLPQSSEEGAAFWVSDNLAKDKIYIDEIKEDAQNHLRQQVSVLPGNPLYVVKELSQSTSLAFTAGFDRQKKILQHAQQKLAEAEGLLEKGDTEKAKSFLNDFKNEVQAVAAWVKEREAVYPQEALQLTAEMKELLNLYEKQFSVVLPTEQLYVIKEAVRETKVLAALGPLEKTEAKLASAADKLLEAHDLAEQGNTQAAARQVRAYSSALADVVSDVKNLSKDEKEKAVTAILDTKGEDLKLLKSIAATAPPAAPKVQLAAPLPPAPLPPAPALVQPEPATAAPPPEPGTETGEVSEPEKEDLDSGEGGAVASEAKNFENAVSTVTTETLTKLGEAVLQVQNEKPSVEVLQKLDTLRRIDINGKPLVNVQISKDKVMVRSNGETISVIGTGVIEKTPAPAEATSSSTLLPKALPPPSSIANPSLVQ